jgi:hypothetical protein
VTTSIVSFSTLEEWIVACDGPKTEGGTSSSSSSSFARFCVSFSDDDDARTLNILFAPWFFLLPRLLLRNTAVVVDDAGSISVIAQLFAF